MKARVTIAAASLALAGCLALFGCSSGGSEDKPAADQGGSEPASQPADEQKQEPAEEAKYAVTIDDCAVTEDYSGAPAIVVTYTFTNNAEKATPFMTAISAKCFQNGVELDTAIVQDIDAQSALNEVKPGATTTVQEAYLLDDQSDVSVECTELISLDDTVLAEKTFPVA